MTWMTSLLINIARELIARNHEFDLPSINKGESTTVVVNKDVASLRAAIFISSGSIRSGLSQTSSRSFQFLVWPDQRSGWRNFATS